MRCVRAAVLVCASGVLACSRGEQPPADTAAQPAAAPVSASSASSRSAAPHDGCPKWGDWRICSVEDRLAAAGLVLERDPTPVRHRFMSVPGVRYTVYKAEAQIFVYPSTADRERDTDALDTLTVAPRGERIIWPEPATLVTTRNLAAIILSVNARQSERIALALGAGLPPNPP